jgi:hypothetical protein
MENYRTNFQDVQAIYYDFLPTLHSAKKVLWVQLRTPPPSSLKIGTIVKLTALDRNLGLPSQSLQVTDVIGTRVVLSHPSSRLQTIPQPRYDQVIPFVAGNQKLQLGWNPLDHDDHWAYALKDWAETVRKARNWTYGSGVSVAHIVW